MFNEFTLISADQAAAKLGQKIKQHRIARNITQADLAKRTGVSERTLKRIESAGHGSLRDLMAIAIELEIDLDILNAIPQPPLRSLADLDDNGHRIQRTHARASRRTS